MTTRARQLTVAILAALSIMPLRSLLAEPLHVYAAGSRSAAFKDIVAAFPAANGEVAPPVFGPSGVLRERIERGDHADVLRRPIWISRVGWHVRAAGCL